MKIRGPSELVPEERFQLLACSVGDARERSRALASAAQQGLDGERLLTSTLKNRIVPLVHRALHDLGGAGLAPQHLALFELHARRHQTEALLQVAEMVALVGELGRRGIRAVPYKGPILAATLYDDLGERQHYDLDVLVPREELAAARAAMVELGYRGLDGLEQLAAGDESRYLREDCELHYRHPRHDLTVELHWEALPRRHRQGFQIDGLWQRMVPLELVGHPVEGFGPEDLLFVLCVHAGDKHRWERIQMLADVARICRRHPELDWDLFFARAEAHGRSRTVEVGLLLAWLLLDAALPVAVQARVAGRPELFAQSGTALGRMFRTDSGLPGYRSWRRYVAALEQRALQRAGAAGARSGRVRYLWTVSAPEWIDRQSLGLPARLSWLYWLYRPLRLARKHGLALWGRL